jgi:hypothetical protein
VGLTHNIQSGAGITRNLFDEGNDNNHDAHHVFGHMPNVH